MADSRNTDRHDDPLAALRAGEATAVHGSITSQRGRVIYAAAELYLNVGVIVGAATGTCIRVNTEESTD